MHQVKTKISDTFVLTITNWLFVNYGQETIYKLNHIRLINIECESLQYLNLNLLKLVGFDSRNVIAKWNHFPKRNVPVLQNLGCKREANDGQSSHLAWLNLFYSSKVYILIKNSNRLCISFHIKSTLFIQLVNHFHCL